MYPTSVCYEGVPQVNYAAWPNAALKFTDWSVRKQRQKQHKKREKTDLIYKKIFYSCDVTTAIIIIHVSVDRLCVHFRSAGTQQYALRDVHWPWGTPAVASSAMFV